MLLVPAEYRRPPYVKPDDCVSKTGCDERNAPPDSGFELRHLRYFVAVAEALHFGRAARALNISQPPLSRQIQDLERHVGTQLLNRTGKSVTLTEAGSVFLGESKRILAQVYRAVETVRSTTGGETARLKTWDSEFFDSYLLHWRPPSMRDTPGQRYRETEMRFHSLTADAQRAPVRRGAQEAGHSAEPMENAIPIDRDRPERDEKLRGNGARVRPIAVESILAGVISGEFDRIPDVNDAFLELVGYSREDLLAGRMPWPNLAPPGSAALDEFTRAEGLRFGACTPFEKELVRKDGTRVPVLIATAVSQVSPFRWITFVQGLRVCDRLEKAGAQEDHGEEYETEQDYGEMVGNSAALRQVRRLIDVVAPTDATVLIQGETGTGKDLVARAIHRASPRKDLPFVTLNCAAIPNGLLESELSGHLSGGFARPLSQKIGPFELAHRGTLFLDKLGDIPLDLQPKLLRALQGRSFERVGGAKTIPIDIRLVAATSRNLGQMVGDKVFRSDLYYRLKVFPITTPLLRDHTEDIPILALHFARKYAATMSRRIDRIPAETIRALVSWPWPGNVRELKNFMERSVILSKGSGLHAPLAEISPAEVAIAGKTTLEQVEREHILRVLRESGGVVTTAAANLGLHRTTLNAMMLKLGISRQAP